MNRSYSNLCLQGVEEIQQLLKLLIFSWDIVIYAISRPMMC